MMKKYNPVLKRFCAFLLASVVLGSACVPAFSALAEGSEAELLPPVVSGPVIEVVTPSSDAELPDTVPEGLPVESEPTAVPTAVPVPTATPQPTEEPLPTEIPMEQESPYIITVTAPNAWTNAAKASVVIELDAPSSMGFSKLEYNAGYEWKDISSEYYLAADNKVSITVTNDLELAVRITDPHGHVFEEKTELRIFDRTAPVVHAGIAAKELRVQAQDDLSGVGGIQVNGLLFTTMDNGELNVSITQVLSKYERLAVRAFDYAGNFSDPVTLDNPYYTPDATPAATTKPTKAPSPTSAATETPFFLPAATPTPQIVYVTPEATATPVVQTEYITIGPGMPYHADGNSHTLDVLYSAATNKQFITIQSKNGNTYYLVIDYDKPIDEDAEMYETYFLNLVDERDLLALMDESEMPTATPQVIYVTPEPTRVPSPTSVPVIADPTDKDDGKQMTAIAALAAIAALGGAGAFFFLKKKGSSSVKPASDYGFDDDDEDEDESDS